MMRWVAGLLAVVGPLIVFGGAYSSLMSWEDGDDVNARENAGRILNSRVIDRGVVEAMELLLERRQPEVLIIGPSYANTDVRPDLIARRLGVPKDRVLLLSVPNSVGSHWYAILKNRVFAHGHRPKLVVVVSGLQSMLLNTPLTESSFVNLGVHLGDEPDPEISSRVKRTTSMQLAHVREQRGKMRESVFDALRFRPAAALMSGPRGGALSVVEVRGALGRVFDDANIDMNLHSASMPIVEADRLDDRAYTADMLPAPDESFIPVITDLVESFGGRTIWVRPPMSPHIPAHLDDVVLPGVQEATRAALSARAGDFVDMRGLPMSAAMFKNEDHMNDEGSRRFSEALATSLQELDAMVPKARPHLAGLLSVSRFSTLDGVESAINEDARDEGRTIERGETLRWDVGEWNSLRGRFAARVVVETSESGIVPNVYVGAAAILLEQRDVVDGIVRWEGSVDLPTPEGNFSVGVALGDGEVDGSVRVRAFALGQGLGRVFLEGNAGAMDGHAAELFGVHRLVDGAFSDHTVRPKFLRKAVRVPGHDRALTDLPGPVAAFETERWAFLSDEALIGETNFGSRCSPLRVTEEGRELPDANVPCLEVQRKRGGRSCHTTQRIFFAASDLTDPATNGRKYRLVLDDGRLCDGAVFLYPKDHFSVEFPADLVAGFTEGARYFTLGANYLNQRPAMISVVLRVNGVAVIDERVEGQSFKKGSKVWALQEPVPAGAKVELEVENQASVFYLMTEATLSERKPQ